MVISLIREFAVMEREHRWHSEKQRQILLRRLRLLEEQKAAFGLHTPPYISIEIEDIRGELARIELELEGNPWPEQSQIPVSASVLLPPVVPAPPPPAR